MEIQWGKMILHGLLSAVFYIGLPLGIIYIFDYLNIITFAESFTTSILIFGIVGTVISMLKYAFPKDTKGEIKIAFRSFNLKFPRHFSPKTQKYDFITIGYVA